MKSVAYGAWKKFYGMKAET